MNLRNFLQLALCLILTFAIQVPLPAQTPALSEKAKIEALITHVEGLQKTVFIRNGTSYTPANAAKFLRRKWQSNDTDIKTAADFIRIAATKSSTSGKPYLIRSEASGVETPCGDYLTAELRKLEGTK